MFEPIAIVGRACLLPGAHSPADLWKLVSEKRVAIGPVPDRHWRANREWMLSSGACATDVGGVVSGFEKIWNPSRFPVDSELIADLDPLVHWLLHTGFEALRDAGIMDAARQRIGAIAGNLAYPTEALVDFAQSVYLPDSGARKRNPLNRFSSGYPVHLMCSALGLTAGGYAIDTACASSLYAIKLACDWLHSGRADVMLAGAVNKCDGLMIHSGFTALHALSPTGQSRPFHRDADGLIPAEGAAFVVLKRLNDAAAAGDRILAVVRGIGLSNDGRSTGILTPAVSGQIRAMEAAYAQSGLTPADVSLVECHATGTAIGDAAELQSMTSVFAGVRDLPVTSLKSNIGHAITASGAAGVIKLVEAFGVGVRPPAAGSGPLTEAFSGTPFRVLRDAEPWNADGPRRAAVSSFGFGGNNAHLLLEEYVSGAQYHSAPRLELSQIAVVGLAVQAADGQETDEFISDLLSGKRAIGEKADEIQVPADSLAFPPRDLARALSQQTILLGLAAEAAAQTKLTDPENTSVLIGMQCDGEATRPVIRFAVDTELQATMDGPMDAARVIGCMPNIPANRLNRQLSLTGPSFSVAAEELSGIRAIEIAIDDLANGRISAAVVGASDLCVEPVHAAATQTRPGDAACVMILKRREDALRDGDRVFAYLEPGAYLEPAEGKDCVLNERVHGCFGVSHAADGLLNLAAAVVCVDCGAGADGVPFLPSGKRRTIDVRTDAIGGQSASIRVCESDREKRGYCDGEVPGIFVYTADDIEEVSRIGADSRLAIVATPSELPLRLAEAKAFLREFPTSKTPPEGVFFQAQKIEGELAFVFTGAAAAYSGMGRDLLLALPELAESVARNRELDVQQYAGWVFQDNDQPSDFEQLCGSSFLCQVHVGLTSGVLGLKPDVAIGLSSGETNALFALGAWHGMGAFLREIEDCGLYTRVLGGSAEALDGRSWANYRVSASPAEVNDWIAGEPDVFITIVNAPGDVLIGGEVSACERAADRIGRHRCIRLPMEFAVHCAAVQPAAELWRCLHTRPTASIADVRFYSNASGGSYELSAASIGQALTQQAIETVDFPRTIRAAWDDGVRIFVEHGPRNQCTQSIRTILEGLPHLAISLDVAGRSSLRQALNVAAEFWCAGLAVDIPQLQAKLKRLQPRPAESRTMLRFPAHPPLPKRPDDSVFVMKPAPGLAPLLVEEPVFVAAPRAHNVVSAMHAAMTEAHRVHVAEITRTQDAFLVSQRRLMSSLDSSFDANIQIIAPVTRLKTTREFSRHDLEILASDRISSVFGDMFCEQDQFPRQVRMPEPPLLLADRVVDLTGEPNSMGLGSIVTETDVTANAWYLHQGRMPAGIAVESGQADLLLISWLGIDRLNRGERVYRLLGCELTFHGSLPKVGETLRYEIHVDGHASHGGIRMFFFHYDCRVNGEPRLTVRQGQAGFFSDRELAESEGVLWSAESAQPTPQPRLAAAPCLTNLRVFDGEHIRAFAEARPVECFGEEFARAFPHTRSPRIQNERMLFLESIPVFDPDGGPWKRGYLRAESKISRDDWFFEGHFKNDPCMPGTLMFEGCLQAMAFYLSALGFTLERDGWRFEPVPEETYSLRCRGQVLPSSKLLVYEVFVDEIIAGPEPALYADVLCTVDGLKAFHCRRLGLRLVPDWPLEERQPERSANIPFDQESLMACALGRPSHAFGPAFVRFDGSIRVPRLPGPPYHFMSRVTHTETGQPVAGAVAEAEYDVSADAWYFAENGHPVMPISVLTEVLLQPCGWLASYAGTWLDVKADIFFRNLDGEGIFHSKVTPKSGTLKTRVTLTSCSPVGAMSITAFRIVCRAGKQLVFEGTAVFGHFPAESLKNQAGLVASEDELGWLAEPVINPVSFRDLPNSSLLGRDKLKMVDRVGWWPEAGRAKLGMIRAEKDIDPREWFFKAHFFSDPVQPGSLGLEAVMQTLQAYMLLSSQDSGMRSPRFEAVATASHVNWTYRGQILPHNKLMTVFLEVMEVVRSNGSAFAKASASLWVDGKKIYAIPECGMRLVDSADSSDIEFLDSINDSWLQDHCPTYTIPVLPMMSVLDRLAFAAYRGEAHRNAPHRRVVEVRDVRLNGWIPIGREPRRIKTESVQGEELCEVALSVWREAPHKEMSRYDAMATATARLADEYPDPPRALSPLVDVVIAHDPPDFDIYEAGELFHGPQFRFLTNLRRSATGASFVLDASANAVPRGFLDQALFDGICHGIPNENLRLWSDRIPADQVGYPSRIVRLSLFADCPLDRQSSCEVRFTGFYQEEARFPQFLAQLIRDGRVWAEMELVYALFPKGPLGIVSGRARREFLQDRIFVPGMMVGTHHGGVTQVTLADLQESDWLPGTIDQAFGITGRDRLAALAIRQHVAQTALVHPASVTISEDLQTARCGRFPITAYPIALERTGDVAVVRNSQPQLDCEIVRAAWEKLSGIADWPIADLHIGLIERFVRSVELVDPGDFAALRGKRVLYVANHQVAVESILANVLLTALSGVPIQVIAKKEHRKSWIGKLIDFAARYPGARQPEPILFFDRADASSIFHLLKKFRTESDRNVISLMAHVEGTRAKSSRTPVTRVSSVLLDFAMESDLPVVPVFFSGGLPADPVETSLEFPYKDGQQDIRVGSAIAPETLRGLSLAQRSALVINKINALAPENEQPLPSNPRYAAAGTNPLIESLRLASHKGKQSQELLKVIAGESEPASSWVADLVHFLRSPGIEL
jgi:acyl transferase domain-containing protein/3-hydroxymyristoyl/3-hydroxydecanoyl-(acyl carrier protein) dehydratase